MTTLTFTSYSHNFGRLVSHLSERHIIFLLILLAVVIRLPLVAKPFSIGGGDAWRETDTASIAHNFYDGGGFNILYPQINWGGNGPGYVETEFQLYTQVVALLYVIFGEQPWLGRMVSLIFLLPTLLVFYQLARRLLGSRAALFSLAFMVISPLSIRYSTTFMPESTVFLFYILALYLFQKWLDTQALPILILTGISTALAVLVKPTSIHIGLIFLLMLIQQFRWRLFKRWDIWLFAFISLLPATLWYLHARNLYLTYGNTFGLLSGGDAKFGNLNYYLSPGFYWAVARIDLTLIFAYGGVPLFLCGLAIAMRKYRTWLPLYGLITVGIYYMIVARYATFSYQYHIFMLPYAALGFGLGLDWVVNHIKTRFSSKKPDALVYLSITAACIGLMVISSLVAYTSLLKPSLSEEIECAYTVAELTPPEARIIVSTTSQALYDGVQNNYQEPEIFYFSHRYGWSLAADQHTPAAVEEYLHEGASYFVMYSQELLLANPALAQYLQNNAEQVGPGVEAGCGVFRFEPQMPS